MTPLLRWALERKAKLALSVTEIRGLEKYGLFDYQVELTWLGHRCEGRGTDIQAELALVKAIAESLEASLIRHCGLTNSNGVAAHPDFDQARRLSNFELYERDLWLCHFLTKTPFNKVDFENPLCDLCNEEKISLNFYSTRKNDFGTTVMAVARGDRAKRPFGLIVGLGFGPREAEQNIAKKAWTECARSLLYVLKSKVEDGPSEALTLCQFSNQSLHTPRIQGSWALSLESIPSLFPWVDLEVTSSAFAQRSLSSHSSSNSYRILNDPSPHADSLSQFPDKDLPPIYIVQCLNPKLQSLHFGFSKPHTVCFERLREFLGHPIQLEELNPLPHPLA